MRSDSNIRHRTSILRSQQKYSNFIATSTPKQLIQISQISILLILLDLELVGLRHFDPPDLPNLSDPADLPNPPDLPVLLIFQILTY